ncbi:MAG: DUF4097 domain-containing protein [SAR202 cluster bacterium]|jgi:DUF4097 and DUF4098 domain-containing protein YvlB|nr:DUF4097 family beta strand repeat-containing protein [SAR202 cluster bacterium]HAL47487.1 hypothetical protein [Dehalococcoidia bacterium]MDP6664394.1 DUF4097 family beta strand repeat-containing protein [SAR202 cluster bacterium]MDP6800480.1 DUF4097 family beta strand repeat-containing protein [SAR202 cluster bacterium]MQG59532.1 DUF4097 domain-containing protein [SAR202 cluster bacterium]|tara:strand:- start:5088 stop:6050 length:963 start_codon:yes stop_codon:yes gene_type:complete
MIEDNKRVLTLLAEGSITAEEAERLLAALGEAPDDAGPSDEESDAAPSRPERIRVDLDLESDERTEKNHDDTFTIGGSPTLIVETFNGRIEIEGDGPADSIRVRAEIRNPGRVDYRVVQDGDTVRVVARATHKHSILRHFGFNRGARIRVTVPRTCAIQAKSSNGRLNVKDVTGDAKLRSSNGRISLEGVEGVVDASTSNSRINVVRVVGDVTLHTSNGRIEIDEGRGSIDAETSNGAISYKGEMLAGSHRLKTSNGAIAVELLGEPSVKLEASTSNGSVTCERPFLTRGMSNKNRLEGTIGAGEATLTLRTSNGSVTVA